MPHVDLEGVRAKELDGPMVKKNRHAFLTALKNNRVCSAASDEGSITVWKRDDGKYGCEFDRYMIPQSKEIFSSKHDVAGWLRKWLPRLDRSK